MSKKELRRHWCDRISMEDFHLDEPTPRVLGCAWICRIQEQSKWKFELVLPFHVNSKEFLDWSGVLPAANMTRWISLDFRRCWIQVDPAAAVPDLD